MTPPPWLTFFPRRFPSANMVLVRGERPVLIDTGFGSDLPATEALLREAGLPAQRLYLIVNTHYHSDHVGGNHGLQERHGLPIAAHRWEAALVNRRDPAACSCDWLGQPVESYRIDRLLEDGDVINAGGPLLQVLHTPGHSLGHISLYAPDDRVLILGDTVHGDDVAWINPFCEGAGAVHRALHTLDRLAALPVAWACSGHGPALDDFPTAIDSGRRRLERFLAEPEKMAWHGLKRTFAYALMLADGIAEAEVRPYLGRCPWLHDYSHHIFRVDPADFIEMVLAEMLRSGAAAWKDGRLQALAPYTPPAPGWLRTPGRPALWPAP